MKPSEYLHELRKLTVPQLYAIWKMNRAEKTGEIWKRPVIVGEARRRKAQGAIPHASHYLVDEILDDADLADRFEE